MCVGLMIVILINIRSGNGIRPVFLTLVIAIRPKYKQS